jgi:protein TonB
MLTEPPPVVPDVAPTPVAEPVAEAPVAGLQADTTVGVAAKGFAVGSSAVGAKTGTSQTPAGNGAVSVSGIVGGTGDRSRAAGLADGRRWDCSFPRAADDEGIDEARVTLEVHVGAGNTVESARVVSDPGFGFGQEARRCAMRRRWLSQLDRNGTAIAGRLMVDVNFVR